MTGVRHAFDCLAPEAGKLSPCDEWLRHIEQSIEVRGRVGIDVTDTHTSKMLLLILDSLIPLSPRPPFPFILFREN